MGAYVCPCKREEIETIKPEANSIKYDIVNQIMKDKLQPQNILYEYTYNLTKICLIKSEQIEEFCNNRNLFKFYKNKNKDACYFFNNFLVTNFMSNKDTVMIILQYVIQEHNENRNSISKYPKVSRFDLVSGIYKVENLKFQSPELENKLKEEKREQMFREQLVQIIEKKTMKNFIFNGIIYNSQKEYKLIFKRNMDRDQILNYEILIFKGDLDEENLKNILSEEKNKFKLLKGILSHKQKTSNKIFYLIFEYNIIEPTEYDYLFVSVEKGHNNKENFMRELTKKLNNNQSYYQLISFVSYDNKLFLVFTREANKSMYIETENFTEIINNN